MQRQFEPNPVRHGGWPVPYTAHDIVASGTRYRVVLLDGYTKRVQREQGYWLPAVLQGDSVLVVLIGPGPFEEAVRGAVMRHAEPTHLALVVGAGHQDQAALPGGGWGEMVLDIQSSANIRLDKTLEVVVRGERWRWANDTGWRRMPD